MARNTSTLTIDKPNRDNGKVFLITEASPMKAYKWAAKLLVSMAAAGMEVDSGAGIEGLLSAGVNSLAKGLTWDLAEPLLDELLECAQFQPSEKIKRPVFESDIEEITTIFAIQMEVIKLHTNFTTPAAQ
jgi:hypothetical protein